MGKTQGILFFGPVLFLFGCPLIFEAAGFTHSSGTPPSATTNSITATAAVSVDFNSTVASITGRTLAGRASLTIFAVYRTFIGLLIFSFSFVFSEVVALHHLVSRASLEPRLILFTCLFIFVICALYKQPRNSRPSSSHWVPDQARASSLTLHSYFAAVLRGT